MKKFLIPALLLCTVVLLAGCGNKEEVVTPENSETPAVEEVQEVQEVQETTPPEEVAAEETIAEEPAADTNTTTEAAAE